MIELRDAIAAEDWPRALGLALEAWRETRSPVYANLVDRIAARAPSLTVPAERVQRWWMQRARTYDAVAATALLANAAELALRGGVEKKLLDRFEVLATWPDDPRVARVFATWFAEANVGWMYAHEAVTHAFYEELVERIVRLRDTRVIPQLEQVLAEPRGKTLGLRELQRRLAAHAIDVLADCVLRTDPVPGAGEIARWVPAPVTVPATNDERALWSEAAERADARLVLADYLLERGDRRGEIITLACAGGEDNARRSSALLHEHWERWMGELALVLDRGGCTFVDGLLDVATVGVYGTPEWAYAKVAQHRELTTIGTVRPGWNASDKGYVAFLDALPRLPSRVRLLATMIEPLALARARWPVRTLELVTNLPDLRVPLQHTIELAASVMPDVEEVELPMPGELDLTVLRAVGVLPQLFPRCTRVRVDAARQIARDIREALNALAAVHSFIEIDHGHY